MDKITGHSPDGVAANVDLLISLLPSVATELRDSDGKLKRGVDFDRLRQELSDHVVEGPRERYVMDWPGKRAAGLAANEPVSKTLRPNTTESVNFDDTKNLFIEGDNLDALKLIQESYLGRVRTIFIDPPYNTGRDFLYRDSFEVDRDDYLEGSGQIDEAQRRLVANTESNGRFHSDWLSMMYPRLKLARSLLAENGSVFVAIDSNEVHNMRKLMDEVFGAQNFQREIVWRIGWLSGFKTVANNFIRNHDVILFYSKNASALEFNKEYIQNQDFKPLVKESKAIRERMAELGLDREAQAKLLDFINHENRPERYPLEDTWNSNEYDDLNSIAIVSFSGEKISKILDIGQDFVGQKSIKMIQRIIRAASGPNDIVMDFFAGTASTAHAVWEQNEADGGARRFIMIQLPELTEPGSAAEQAGYTDIADIARERLRRVGERYSGSADTGFRCLEVDSSCMVQPLVPPDHATQDALFSSVRTIRDGRSPLDILFEVIGRWGLDFSAVVAEEGISGTTVLSVDDGALLACFDEQVDSSLLRGIASRKPLRAVFLDSSFESDAARINAEQIFAELSPTTDVKVI